MEIIKLNINVTIIDNTFQLLQKLSWSQSSHVSWDFLFWLSWSSVASEDAPNLLEKEIEDELGEHVPPLDKYISVNINLFTNERTLFISLVPLRFSMYFFG